LYIKTTISQWQSIVTGCFKVDLQYQKAGCCL
jgi:hypothetical protein